MTSTMAALRAATRESHQRLEARLDVKERFFHTASYARHLQKMWGFCSTLEEQIEQEGIQAALDDFESRRKVPLLRQDLLTLGAEARLDFAPAIQIQTGPAAALGCAYVIEGSTLGGRTLLPLVGRQLGLTAHAGAQFLASYGERTQSMWLKFGQSLDTWCCNPDRQASAIAAAIATFAALETWLCE